MDSFHLSEYSPASELITEEHIIQKPRFPVIDIHMHFGLTCMGADYYEKYSTEKVIQTLDGLDIKHVINLDGFWGDELDRMMKKIKGFEYRIITFGTVDVTRIDEDDFSEYVQNTLKEGYKKGIRGVKFLKSLGLVHKDKNGRYIRPDDERLKPVWETAALLDIPVLIHIADPIAFFKKADQYNERYEELSLHPDWQFNAPGFYKFNELMEMQETLLFKNPRTTFVVAHVGSASENLGFVSGCLDNYPNMHIDIAARIGELGRQPYSSRDFFIKYQDRILFGTDNTPVNLEYGNYFRFLETRDEYFNYCQTDVQNQGRWNIYGIYLPDDVLEKVYYKNAERLLFKR